MNATETRIMAKRKPRNSRKKEVDLTNVQNQKYGVPVSCRINAEVAYDMVQKAEKLGVSLSKYVAIVLQSGISESDKIAKLKQNYESKISDLEEEIRKYKTTQKETITRLIEYCSNENPRKQQELIKKYTELREVAIKNYNLKI